MRALLATAVVLAMLTLSLPAFAQVDPGQQYCDWYWDYTFSMAGGWEYWCWDARKGWWYAESEDGNSHRISISN
jgi:hypothetical protein